MSAKLNTKQIEFLNKYKKPILVDEDCTNKKIDVQECINKNNRYFPNAPPEFKFDWNKFENLIEERMPKFIELLKSNNFRINESEIEPSFTQVVNLDSNEFEKIFKFPPDYKVFIEIFLNGLKD